MKICVATNKGGLEDNVATLFGRCATFTFVDVEGNEIKNTEVVKNLSAIEHRGGAQRSQVVIEKGTNVAIAGSFGPNAFNVLKSAGIKVVSSPRISVKDAVMKYLNGELKEASPVEHSGMHGEGRGYGRGQDSGRGLGRGRGGGRGYRRGIAEDLEDKKEN